VSVVPFSTPGPGVVPRPTVTLPNVLEVYNDFMEFKKSETDPRTYDWYQEKLFPFVERFHDRVLASITYEDGLKYKTFLRKEKVWKRGKVSHSGLGDTTVNHHLRAAKTLLTWASKPSRCHRTGLFTSPWAEIGYLDEKPRERLITEEEFAHLLANCTDGNVSGGDEDFREQLTVLRYTTMRPGELRRLKWDYAQWNNNRLVFPSTVIKTRKRREVVMIDVVKETLLKRKARLEGGGQKVGGYVFPLPVKDATSGKRVIPANGERPQKDDHFSQRFRRLVERCVRKGLIEKEKAGERVVPYSTRHTRITELFVEGNDHAVVMFDAGHVIPQTTERYKHLAASHVADAIRRRSQRGTSTDGREG
jgi:integrase